MNRKLLALGLGLGLAGIGCEFGSTNGERRVSGECPEEVCAEETPDGLIFYGQVLYDDPENDRLGPVVVDGAFSLRFGVPQGVVGDWAVETDPPGVLSVERVGTRSLAVTGLAEGEATVRIVDADTGALYDRLTMKASEITGVNVRHAKTDRDYLVAGCSEMVGIDVLVGEGRAFDLDAEMFVDGQPVPEAWDCYFLDVGNNVDEVEFTVIVAGETFEATMPVVEGACQSW